MIRMNSMYNNFSNYAFNAFYDFSEHIDSYRELDNYVYKEGENEENSLISLERLRKSDKLAFSYINCIIYSALSVEAYIYDIGAIKLGDNFTSDHLDKLRTIDKWVVIPQLISKNKIDKSGEWFYLLKLLITARNKLVHAKSKGIKNDQVKNIDMYLEKYNMIDNKNYIQPNEAIKCIFLLDILIRDLDCNDPIHNYQLYNSMFDDVEYKEIVIENNVYKFYKKNF